MGSTLTLLRMTPIVAAAPAFLNNTPVVAMGIPVTRGWARRNRAKVSRLLMIGAAIGLAAAMDTSGAARRRCGHRSATRRT
ncbi:MAG TPA: hypothetical protein VLA33_07225 [Gemmatimonadota bacterium]|nr:hypothetical protein [Gemmatimonadota bacterium]